MEGGKGVGRNKLEPGGWAEEIGYFTDPSGSASHISL